jgi:hypothetical protein
MPHIHKVRNVNIMCRTPDRLPNIPIGKHSKINTNNILIKDKRLNKYVNDSTMGALDNYANHENMNIYITPLENDLFHDVAVSVYKEHDTIARFPVKINDGQHALGDFLKELYENIAPQKAVKKLDKSEKPSKSDDIKMFFSEKIDNIKNFRINQIRKFVEKNQDKNGIKRTIADAFEEIYSDELYK